MTLQYLLHADAPLKVLIACECSGTVRDAFLALGHDAWSCDIKPDEKGSNRHIRDDVRNVIGWGWDLMVVAHPPCTRLCKSGLRWLHTPPPGRTLEAMWAELEEGCELFSTLWNAPIPRIAIENPDMHRHAQQRIKGYQPASQRVQPWMFGDPVFKTISLWLRGDVAPLVQSNALTPPAYGTPEGRAWEKIHRMPGGKNQKRERSRFFPGVAAAMAAQWGGQVIEQRRAA